MGIVRDWLRERELDPGDFWPPVSGYIQREYRLGKKGVNPCYGNPGKGSDILSIYNRAVLLGGTLLILKGIQYASEILK